MMSTSAVNELNEKIQQQSTFIDALKNEMAKAIIGQQYMVDRLILSLLSNGHILLEGVPGLAKTLAIKSLAAAIHAGFSRIQFTPDLLPADLLGTMIYNQQKNEFTVKKGPVFSNLILADEINRASAKVQSALLQAMQERQVTIGDQTYALDEPFLVLATQNPLEQEGTYPLPEAQVDRFMLKVIISYPEREDERQIIRQQIADAPLAIQPVVTPADILNARHLVRDIYLDEKIEQYILDIVFATRNPAAFKLERMKNLLRYGSSPRGSISLALAAKSAAFMQHRGFVIPDDIKDVCMDVLRHRIGITYEAEAENVTTDDIIREIIRKVEVP
ncbi:MAG: AAA family ATPase [Chitinophagales bacterium]|nr:AAA family ATPase [Chitinophagales bacterium]